MLVMVCESPKEEKHMYLWANYENPCDTSFLYWESFLGGRKGTALLDDLDPIPSFLFIQTSFSVRCEQ